MKNELHPLENLNGKMNTITGKIFDLLNPTAAMVDIIDIATALGNQAHFNGHSPQHFSVAQHCVEVAQLAKAACPDRHDLHFAALLHDAAEAYTGDIIKPLKVLWKDFYSKIEAPILKVIFEKYGIDFELSIEVKQFDLEIQKLEFNQFYKSADNFRHWEPIRARKSFLLNFNYFKAVFETRNNH